MKSGIYCILNLYNGKRYIGSSQTINIRWSAHRSLLRRNAHHSKMLQNSWNKYGEDNFRLDVLEYVSVDGLCEREQFWIDNTRPFYNVLRNANSVRGMRHTDESKEKMRIAKIGSTHSPERRKRQSDALIGRKLSDGHIAKLRNRIVSDETRAKISVGNAGKLRSEEDRIKCGDNRRGKLFSAEQKENLKKGRENMSEENRQRVRDVTVATHSKSYIVTSPTGEVFNVFNLSEFSRNNKLGNGQGLAKVATGSRKQYKGWICVFDQEEAAKSGAALLKKAA